MPDWLGHAASVSLLDLGEPDIAVERFYESFLV
jgi:hypothetical protein